MEPSGSVVYWPTDWKVNQDGIYAFFLILIWRSLAIRRWKVFLCRSLLVLLLGHKQIAYREIYESSYESISGVSSAVFLWCIEKFEMQKYPIIVSFVIWNTKIKVL